MRIGKVQFPSECLEVVGIRREMKSIWIIFEDFVPIRGHSETHVNSPEKGRQNVDSVSRSKLVKALREMSE
jgi:hypothetical protein